ncbi:hypothetical protein LIER_30200 [Lithospermum erythrorhizon]|uniref:HTH myb-type domain-containing protein n=1 Tax=Lithospermum erythrorhizon TaxID=34254 RepID=A0AAV3RPX7_LITER
MREEDSNWFAKWEDELPSPEELMPLSQTLITPDLAIAFDIRNPNSPNQFHPPPPTLNQNQINNVNTAANSPQPNSSAEFDSDLGGTGGNGAAGSGCGSGLDEPARTLKRPRLVWTPQLHKRFVDAVAHLGIKNAVPKTIMQLMSVDGLTRENVASHLQKYRLYLKRMQGINNGGNGGGGNGNSPVGLSGSGVDTAMDRLFASAPVPAHFLRPNADHFMPYPPVSMQVHHPQIAVQPPMVGHGPQLQQQFRHFGHSPTNGQFEHPFLGRQSQQQQVQRIGASIHGNDNDHHGMPASYVEDMESATAANGRKVLTLFPNGED